MVKSQSNEDKPNILKLTEVSCPEILIENGSTVKNQELSDVVKIPPQLDYELQEKGTNFSWWRCQSTLGFMGFLGMTVSYSTRVSLSIAIVDMVGRNLTRDASINLTYICPIPEDDEGTPEFLEGEFEWDAQTQGIVLASFFYGCVSTNIIGGRAAEVYGGRLTFGLGVVLSSILTILSPFCAYMSKEAFIINRVLQGMAQGAVFPAITTLMATWVTPKERNRLVTQIYVGMQAGTILGMCVGGWLCNLEFLGGWPLVFYLFGGLGIIWAIPWFLLIHDRPELHPRISPEELKNLRQCQSSVKSAEVLSIPWKAILRSSPFWCILFMYFSNSYGFFNLLTVLPTYFSRVQHFDIRQNGWTSALPYLVMWIVALLWGALMNWLTLNDKITIKGVRRLSTAIGSYVPASCMIAMCFVGCDSTMALVIISLAVGLNGTQPTGYSSSPQDIAPNLVGTVFGTCNTLGLLAGAIAPTITGAIMNDNETIGAWRTVFLIPTCLWIIATTIFIFFISADVQPWNEPSFQQRAVHKDGVMREYVSLGDISK